MPMQVVVRRTPWAGCIELATVLLTALRSFATITAMMS